MDGKFKVGTRVRIGNADSGVIVEVLSEEDVKVKLDSNGLIIDAKVDQLTIDE